MRSWIACVLAAVVLAAGGTGCVPPEEEDDGDVLPPDAGGTCGNHVCNANETTATCPADCPPMASCGDHVCNGSETTATCPADCPPPPATLIVRNASTLNVYRLYVSSCNSPTWGTNWLGNVLRPNYQVTLPIIQPGCYDFRAENSPTAYWERFGTTLGSGQIYTWTLVN